MNKLALGLLTFTGTLTFLKDRNWLRKLKHHSRILFSIQLHTIDTKAQVHNLLGASTIFFVYFTLARNRARKSLEARGRIKPTRVNVR